MIEPGRRATAPSGPSPDPIPRWALAACPGGVLAGARAPWGFTHETWILTPRTGPPIAVQRRRDRSDPTRPRARAIRAAVRATGVPVPEPARIDAGGRRPVLVLPFVPGVPAASMLGSDAVAEAAGSLCGRVAATLAGTSLAGLHLGGAWTSGRALRAAGRTWAGRCSGLLAERSLRALDAVLEQAATEADAAPAAFAHGDLAPVNILVHAGRVAAVLDLDRARAAPPDYDAAWFLWVVGYHHPEVVAVAWAGYARGADLPPGLPPATAWLQPLQLLELASSSRDTEERSRWAARLEALLGGRSPPKRIQSGRAGNPPCGRKTT